jgi:hypothetical protein
MNKKIVSILLSFLLAFSCFSALPVKAETVTDPATGLIFDTSTGAVTGYNGSPTNLVIPDMIDVVRVTSIGDGAFEGETQS